MNDENLIPASKRSKKEARELGRKGGIASGKKRRDKRTFRETLQTLLEMPCTDVDGNPVVNEINGRPMSIREAIAVQAVKLSMNGDVKHFQTILDILGERTLKIDNNISGGLSAGITIQHVMSGHEPASSEAEVRNREEGEP